MVGRVCVCACVFVRTYSCMALAVWYSLSLSFSIATKNSKLFSISLFGSVRSSFTCSPHCTFLNFFCCEWVETITDYCVFACVLAAQRKASQRVCVCVRYTHVQFGVSIPSTFPSARIHIRNGIVRNVSLSFSLSLFLSQSPSVFRQYYVMCAFYLFIFLLLLILLLLLLILRFGVLCGLTDRHEALPLLFSLHSSVVRYTGYPRYDSAKVT